MSICSCRVCGCTDTRACEGGCWWVDVDLCSTCARKHAVRERPILFSGPMVSALLDGRKTQTRRVVKPPRGYEMPSDPLDEGDIGDLVQACRYGRAGDRLWVRETWAHVPATAYRCSDGVQQTNDPTSAGMAAVYAAGWERSAPGRWKPSIHMPRWACRLVLEIADVRVQRLHDISEDDAIAEGIHRIEIGSGYPPMFSADPRTWADAVEQHPDVQATPVAAFRELWESINGLASWAANPWVWAVTFRREEAASA